MINPRKSGGVMNFGQALWMMEATFNYFHSFVSENFLTTTTDTTYIEANYTLADEITLGDLAELFIETNNTIVGQYQACELPNKKPMLFDLEHEATTNGYRLALMTTMGQVDSRKNLTVSSNEPFGETDYWYPVNKDGKCGEFEGTYAGSLDATDAFEYQLRANLRESLIGYYYADIFTVGPLEGRWLEDAPLSFDSEYLLFYGEFSECINPTRMNHHYNNFTDLIDNYEPIGKTFANIDVFADPDVSPGDEQWNFYYYHSINYIKYGVLKKKTPKPGDEPLVPTEL